MQIFDRKRDCYTEEKEYGLKKLKFLYQTIPGRIILKTVVCKRWYSEYYAKKRKSRRSIKEIAPFVEKYHIDLSLCEKKEFQSFNDFFTRRRSYETKAGNQALIAIADSRLSCFTITENLILNIKNSSYSLGELTGLNEIPSAFRGGSCLVFRLAVEDYHRYVYLDHGKVGTIIDLDGKLHTVRPISAGYRVFATNHRMVTQLMTQNFGEVYQIEVGALTVGKIVNYPVMEYERLQEKGYFEYGGSTIILLFEKDRVRIDSDICDRNLEGVEVKVSIGEKIGQVI